MAVMLSQVLAQIGQVKAAGDGPEQVLLGNDGLKIEGVEQMILPDWLTPHHLDHPTQNMQYAYYTLGRFSTPSTHWRQSRKVEADLDLFDYIEPFYNRKRRHSTLGYASPEKFLEAWLSVRHERQLAA